MFDVIGIIVKGGPATAPLLACSVTSLTQASVAKMAIVVAPKDLQS